MRRFLIDYHPVKSEILPNDCPNAFETQLLMTFLKLKCELNKSEINLLTKFLEFHQLYKYMKIGRGKNIWTHQKNMQNLQKKLLFVN